MGSLGSVDRGETSATGEVEVVELRGCRRKIREAWNPWSEAKLLRDAKLRVVELARGLRCFPE